jgi:hypothetical protein
MWKAVENVGEKMDDFYKDVTDSRVTKYLK